MMNDDLRRTSILQHLAALVAIDTSNPPREIAADGPLVAYLRQVLVPLGFAFEVTDHGAGHLTIAARRGAPEVLFNVHLDTVPATPAWTADPWALHVTAERATGLGACDIKGAAAALLHLAAAEPDLPLALLMTTDEEGSGGCCVKRFCAAGLAQPYRQAVIAEPTGGRAILAHRGFLSAHGRFSGAPGHSSEPRALANNALHQAVGWAAEALALARAEQTHEIEGFKGICLNIGRLAGGVKSNVIASEAIVHWSARPRPGEDCTAWHQRLCETDEGRRAVWEAPFTGPPLPAPGQTTEAAEHFVAAHDLPRGAPVQFWTEASLFSAAGVPALVLGPGEIAQAHAADEWVALEQLTVAYRLYARLAGGRGDA